MIDDLIPVEALGLLVDECIGNSGNGTTAASFDTQTEELAEGESSTPSADETMDSSDQGSSHRSAQRPSQKAGKQPEKISPKVNTTQPALSDVQCRRALLIFKVPSEYPRLESPINIFLPMDFTYTQVDALDYDAGNPWLRLYQQIRSEIFQICATFEPGISCLPVYGRVHVLKQSLLYHRNIDLISPRVLAFCLEPEDMYRWWKVELRMERLLQQTFGTARPPVRYYYGNVLAVGF